MSTPDVERLTSCPDDDTSCPTCDAFWESGAVPEEETAAQQQPDEVSR